jgi:protein TonB
MLLLIALAAQTSAAPTIRPAPPAPLAPPPLVRRAVVNTRLDAIALRGMDTVWEVHADGRQRSCRRINHFATGEQLHIDGCSPVNARFIAAAAAHLQVPPGEVLTVRLENDWLVDSAARWQLREQPGEVLVQAEAAYELNDDQSVLSCTLGSASAKFTWRMEPCFKTSFKGQVPPDVRSLRLQGRWVVARGSDTERPKTFPRLVRGKSADSPPAPLAFVPPPPPLPPRAAGVTPARARANLASYLTDDDYPKEAIRWEQQGTAAFRLTIDRGGMVSACLITSSSGSAILDETTCRILQMRARFTPARDRRGRAVEDVTEGRIMWRLPEPEDEIRMKLPLRQTVTYRISADGTITDCRGESHDGGEVAVREGANCPASNTPAAVLAAIRSQSASAEPRVKSELRTLRRPGEPWPQYKAAGQKVLGRVDARLTVEADGKVSGCTVLESTSLIGPTPSPCNATGLLMVDPRGLTLPGEVRVSQVILLEDEPAKAK